MFGLMADMMNVAKGTDGDYVDEITVDDFFDSLIEALDNDKDVFEYKSDTYSHPLLGKVVSISTISSKVSIQFLTSTTLCAVHGWLQPLHGRAVRADDGRGRGLPPRPLPVPQPPVRHEPLRPAAVPDVLRSALRPPAVFLPTSTAVRPVSRSVTLFHTLIFH